MFACLLLIPSQSPLHPVFYATSLADLNEDLLRELTTYLPLTDIASFSGVSKYLAASSTLPLNQCLLSRNS